MNQIEYIEQKAALEQEQRTNKRANATMLDIIEQKHRDLIAAENERYEKAKRQQLAEYHEKVDNLYTRLNELKRQRALSIAEEEKNK